MGNTVGGDDMALSGEDWARLDDRLDRIFDAMERNRIAADMRLNEHSTKINAVSVYAVKSITETVAAHEDKHHDPKKKLGILASIMAIAGGIGGGVAWVMSKLGIGEK